MVPLLCRLRHYRHSIERDIFYLWRAESLGILCDGMKIQYCIYVQPFLFQKALNQPI